MRKTRISEVNHHSKNLRQKPTIAEDTDTSLLSADKSSKTIKINHRSTKNQLNHSITIRKKINIYQTKTFIVTKALENHSQIAQIIQEINQNITLTTELDHQIKNQEIAHKIDIVDHTVEKSIIEIIIHDQTQTDRIIRLIPVPIHILGIDTFHMIDQETHHTIDTEMVPTKGREVNQIIAINNISIDYEIIQTIDQITKVLIITIIKVDHEKTHNTGIQTITKDKETTLNHPIGLTQVIQILKKNI